MNGGRYNPPNEFGILYTCDSQLTANLEVNALFVDRAGRLVGAPRNPDLMLTLPCELIRVLDLRRLTTQRALGTARSMNSSRTFPPDISLIQKGN